MRLAAAGSRAASVTIIILFAFANLWQTAQLLQTGRGHYSDAVAYLSSNTAGPMITVVSDDVANILGA